jgi:hypothetical protein
MDRRKFIGSLIGGVAGVAATRTFPFRVYSFPTEIQTFVFSDFALFIAKEFENLESHIYSGQGTIMLGEPMYKLDDDDGEPHRPFYGFVAHQDNFCHSGIDKT